MKGRSYFGVAGIESLLIAFAFTVRASPASITFQPQNQTVILYQPAAFSVIADGTPLTYQWLKNGAPIAGATNDQILLPHGQFPDEGTYSVIVSNAENSATSANAELMVKLPQPGNLDYSFDRSVSSAGWPIQTAMVQNEGKTLMGGGTFLGLTTKAVARVQSNGNQDPGFVSGLISGAVYSLSIQSNGNTLVAGYLGYYTKTNGVTRTNTGIGRLDANGSVDNGFQCSIGGNSWYLRTTALKNDGKILIGGVFQTVNGIARTNIARLNPDGSLDSEFQTAISPGFISTIVGLADGKFLIAGEFTNINGLAQTNIARLNADGSLDNTFQCTDLIGNFILSIAPLADGRLLVGGLFTNANGAGPTEIARLNPDGSLDNDFKATISSLNGYYGEEVSVHAIVIQPDNRILVGGGFNLVNGVARTNIVRLDADGSLDGTFCGLDFGADAVYDPVECIALQNDGKIFIGGEFTALNGAAAAGYARLWGTDPAPVQKNLSFAGTNVNLTWHAISNRSYRVQYTEDLSQNKWTDLPGDVSATNDLVSKMDASGSGAQQRFYRVLELP